MCCFFLFSENVQIWPRQLCYWANETTYFQQITSTTNILSPLVVYLVFIFGVSHLFFIDRKGNPSSWNQCLAVVIQYFALWIKWILKIVHVFFIFMLQIKIEPWPFQIFPKPIVYIIFSGCQKAVKVAEIENIYKKGKKKRRNCWLFKQILWQHTENPFFHSSQNKLPPPCGSAPPSLVITFSFRQKLDQLVSGRLLGVLIVLLQSRADDCGGLVIARDLRVVGKQRDRRLEIKKKE